MSIFIIIGHKNKVELSKYKLHICAGCVTKILIFQNLLFIIVYVCMYYMGDNTIYVVHCNRQR